MKTAEKRLGITFVTMNFFMSVYLAGLIFCVLPAPAVGASELKADLVNQVREGRSKGWESVYAQTGQKDLVARCLTEVGLI
jgi:hypothetical protein